MHALNWQMASEFIGQHGTSLNCSQTISSEDQVCMYEVKWLCYLKATVETENEDDSQ